MTALCAAAALISGAIVSPAAAKIAVSAPQIVSRIDEMRLATLPGNTPPEARPENDLGQVPDNTPINGMEMALHRPGVQQHLLDTLLQDQLDRSSPRYHHWLKSGEFGWRFGAAVSDIDKIVGWLGSHGLRVTAVSRNRMRIDFSGTAGELRDALHTEFHRVRVNGEDHITNISDPQVPAALAPAIVGIAWMNDFKPKPLYTGSNSCEPYQNGQLTSTCYWVAPADLWKIYSFPRAAYNGSGQTIALLENTDPCCTNNQSQDWCAFRGAFFAEGTCPTQLFSVQHPLAQGSQQQVCTDPGWIDVDIESALDPQWASAAAPGANIVVVACKPVGNTPGTLIALENWIDWHSGQIISTSWGECEADMGTGGNAIVNSTYEQADAEGFSVFSASGDEGAALCDAGVDGPAIYGISVNGWASSPYVVGVGGTTFADWALQDPPVNYWSAQNGLTYGSALSYIPEIAWNESCGNGVLSAFYQFSQTYGASGFCNSSLGYGDFTGTVIAGSGGPSNCAVSNNGVCQSGYAKPAWQNGILGNPGDGVRDVPDVSIVAGGSEWGHYLPFCNSDPGLGRTACTSTGGPSSWSYREGTSFSSPIFAGIQALINQKTGQATGLPNPTYYSLGAQGYSNVNCQSKNAVAGNSCVFYDVTDLVSPNDSSNDVPCVKYQKQINDCFLDGASTGVLSTSNFIYYPAYPSQPGWDFTTGVGTPNVANLVNAWPN